MNGRQHDSESGAGQRCVAEPFLSLASISNCVTIPSNAIDDLRNRLRSARRLPIGTSVGPRQGSGRKAGKKRVAPRKEQRVGDGMRLERRSDVYAALDLGTNNCRLLVARAGYEGFRVVDGIFANRPPRRGAGDFRFAERGLRSAAPSRPSRSAATRWRCAASPARASLRPRPAAPPRMALTSSIASKRKPALPSRSWIAKPRRAFAAAGCASLADPKAADIVLFRYRRRLDRGCLAAGRAFFRGNHARAHPRLGQLPFGVVTLADRYGGVEVSDAIYGSMVEEVGKAMEGFRAKAAHVVRSTGFHMLGTSGTVTTIAGVHLALSVMIAAASMVSGCRRPKSMRACPYPRHEFCRARRECLHR